MFIFLIVTLLIQVYYSHITDYERIPSHNKGGHIGANGRINWFKEDNLVRPGGYFGNWRTLLLKMGGHFRKGGYFGLFWEDTLAQFF